MPQESLVFLSGKRTPFGSNGGSLREVNPTELCVQSGKAALDQSKVDSAQIDHVVIGNVLHSAADSIYTPRHTGLKLGIPQHIPALGINRLCGSGFQVIVEAYHQILAGDTQAALVGGVENMSMSPYVLRKARWGMRLGHGEAEDMMTAALFDPYPRVPMAITAENLAEKYQISRDEVDQFALQSQLRTENAQKENRFADEICPFILKDRKGNETPIQKDEHPRSGMTMESLAKLKPIFKKDGVVTAGNASGIVDGAAMMVVSSETFASKNNLKPLGRLVSYGIVGCDPAIMGIGPAPATRKALDQAGMKLEQMDLIEINEAFSPQTLAVIKELGVNPEILNVNGGAISIGHPLAASGTRIMMQLFYELRRRKKKYGLGTACIGGGQGIALVVEAF